VTISVNQTIRKEGEKSLYVLLKLQGGAGDKPPSVPGFRQPFSRRFSPAFWLRPEGRYLKGRWHSSQRTNGACTASAFADLNRRPFHPSQRISTFRVLVIVAGVVSVPSGFLPKAVFFCSGGTFLALT